MKKAKIFRQLLAGSLGLMLVLPGAVPAVAAEAQQAEKAMEATVIETQAVAPKAAVAPEVEAVGAQQYPEVKSLAVKEMNANGFVFSHAPVSGDYDVYYEYSTNKNFDKKKAKVETLSWDTLSYSNLKAGVTYYVRAYTAAYSSSSERGKYSKTIQVKAPVAEVTDIETEILDKGITLTLDANYGLYSGFQIDRKAEKGKYKNLATTAASRFKDKGLKKNTKYTYRVRAYAYNPDNGKTYYGDYSYKTVETGAAAMDLKAQVAGKTTVKLTWKKVSSAAGYDVYRSVGTNSSTTRKSGVDYGFTKYELIKSLSKKKVSYTDKNLQSGYYSYRIRAYKLVNGNKVYFTEDYASNVKISAKFSVSSAVTVYKQAQNPKSGKVTIAWYPVPQAKGYLVEKYDDAKDSWVTQKKITKASTRSYTLPASSSGKTVDYRVRAYSGSKYSRPSSTVSVQGHIAAVTGVKAKATANGIKISWNKVNGASYYRVYRTADPVAIYDADTKTYSYSGNRNSVEIQVFKNADPSDNYYYTLGDSTAKMQEDYEAARKQAYQSPYESYVSTYEIKGTSVTDYAYDYHTPVYDDKGVVTGEEVDSRGIQNDVSYHYYVIAYKEVKDGTGYRTADSYGYSKSASAKLASKAGKAAPTIQKIKAGKKTATITIKKVTGAKKYQIYRSTKKNKGYKLVKTTTKTSYKDTKLTSKKTYYYKVKAVTKNGLGEDVTSSFSKVKSVKVK
ncbi:MAG: hypothetical protein HFG80_11050 [Eubacterium sp.]|nr:hypothetical protein [Eubacterium sp.]